MHVDNLMHTVLCVHMPWNTIQPYTERRSLMPGDEVIKRRECYMWGTYILQ